MLSEEEEMLHGVEGSWEARIVAALLEMRAAGVVDFEEAWAEAIGLVPYVGGHREPTAPYRPAGFPEWFGRMCRREWCGQVHVDYAGLAEFAAGLDEGGVTAVGAGVGALGRWGRVGRPRKRCS